jgi:TrmH family RNA methyltransferase
VALITALSVSGIPIEPVSEAELSELATTEQPQGVVAVFEPRRWRVNEISAGVSSPVVVLDGVQDPGNVGTIARTALAFGAAGMIALPGTVDLTNPKVIRSAAGALFRLPSIALTDGEFGKWLNSAQVSLWVTAMDGEPAAGPAAEPVALLLGNEGAGIRSLWDDIAARRIAIPIRAEAESLNVAVAAGILLHQLGSAG